MPTPPRAHSVQLLALVAAVVTFVVFLPTLGNGFTNWDDDMNFLTNPNYRGLTPANLKWMFTTIHMGPWQPLSWMTLGLDYQLWGMDARGYHLTSLLLHSLNAALLVLLTAALLRRAKRPFAAPALVAALFFSIHPLRVESVAWVTERRDVVSGLFLILATWAYVSDPPRRLLAFGSFILSLLGKATGVTAPVLFLILDVYPLRRLPADPRRWFEARFRGVLVEKIPYVAASAAVGVIAFVAQRREGALESMASFDLVHRLGLVSYAMVFYLWKTIVPLNLSPLYELKPGFNALGPAPLLAAAFLVGVTVLLITFRRRWPAFLAAWLAYLVMIFPVSGIARAGHALASDRYSYIPTIPFAILVGFAFADISRRYRTTATFVALVMLTALGTLTFLQTRIWHDSQTLWRQALRVDPRSEQAGASLAFALVEAGRLDEAERIYRDILARNPRQPDSRYGMGMLLFVRERDAEADAAFRSLVHDAPGFPMGHFGLGLTLMARGQADSARTELQTALRLKPDLAPAKDALARISSRGR